MTTEGMTLALIAQKTGIAKGTIKSLVSRNQELQTMPYSAKAAGARVFFPDFVVWLAEHQGAEVAKVASAATSATRLPNGKQMDSIYRLYHEKAISAGQVQVLLGVAPRPSAPAIDSSEPVASPEVAEAGFTQLREFLGDKGARQVVAVAHRAAKGHQEEIKADRVQGRLI